MQNSRAFEFLQVLGKWTPSGTGMRQTGTKRTDCPFSVLIRSYDWEWDLKVRSGNHNYAPSLSATAHHDHRKRDIQAHGRETIQQLTQIGVEPRRISAAVLSQNPSTLITQTDIYNERSRARQEHLAGRFT